jgi:hypothetical protein
VRQDRRSRRVAQQHHHRALGLDLVAFGLGVLVRGFDDFAVVAQLIEHFPVRLRLGFGVDVDRLEEGPGERRRELHQPVGQRGVRLELQQPEREQPELQFLELQRDRTAEERVEVITS